MDGNRVASGPLAPWPQEGQVVTLRWRGARGGVPAYLDRTPALVLSVGARGVLVRTEDGARRVSLGNVEA